MIRSFFVTMNKYYAVLGLPSTASKDEVRKKYRQLVLIWHPDKNPSPEAHGKFIAITEAYDILMGERTVPRATFTTKRRTAATTAPPPKKNTQQLFREKYLAEREKIRRSPDFQKWKAERAQKILSWKIATGAAVAGIFIPWFVPPFNAITCIFLSFMCVQCAVTFGFHVHNLSRQALMTFGENDKYDYTELRDYYFPEHKLRWGKVPGGGRRGSRW